MKVDWLIVGAGLSGATMAERIASQLGETVLVVEQRDHIAGNAWDEYNEYGILEHKYGPHLFHTNSKEVWDYLSQFTRWHPYLHRVLAAIDGKLVPLPFNFNSIEQIFPASMAARLIDKLVNVHGFGGRIPILKLRESEDADLRFLADYVYKNVFECYTQKQWGVRPEDLAASVTARVPILASRDDRYFQDTYQAQPLHGYHVLVRNMLRNPNIHIMLNTRWQDVKGQVKYKRMVFTGPVDEYFDYKYSQLPYRSLRFDAQTLPLEQYQSAPVVNYPNEHDYTRITEQKWITGQRHDKTTILIEYPQAHLVGQTIPYYPIPMDKNRELYRRYEKEAAGLAKKVLFLGRLANYQYYNMDQVVAKALMITKNIIKEQ